MLFERYAAEITRLRHLLAAKTIEIDQLRNTVRQNDRQSPLPPMSPTPAVSTDRVDIKALRKISFQSFWNKKDSQKKKMECIGQRL